MSEPNELERTCCFFAHYLGETDIKDLRKQFAELERPEKCTDCPLCTITR